MSNDVQAKIKILENEKELLQKLRFPFLTPSSQKILVLSSLYNECYGCMWNGINSKTTEEQRLSMGYTENVTATLQRIARRDLNADVRWFATFFIWHLERSKKGIAQKGLFEGTEFESAYPYYKETHEMDRGRREENSPDCRWSTSSIAFDAYRRQDMWSIFAFSVEEKRSTLEKGAKEVVSWAAAQREFNQKNGQNPVRNLIQRLSGHPEDIPMNK